MSGEAPVLELLQQQRNENNRQFAALRKSNQVVAEAVATLTTTIARVEERHHGQDAGMKRIGTQVDDHEGRMRVVEANTPDSSVIDGHEQRLRKVELNGAKVLGGAIVISFLVPILLKFVGTE